MSEIIYTMDPSNPRVTYTRAHDNMSPAQIWAAWKKRLVTVYQLAKWQQLHNYYFNELGERVK